MRPCRINDCVFARRLLRLLAWELDPRSLSVGGKKARLLKTSGEGADEPAWPGLSEPDDARTAVGEPGGFSGGWERQTGAGYRYQKIGFSARPPDVRRKKDAE